MEIEMSSVGTHTNIGPVEYSVRDRLKDYRDRHDHPNYNSALDELLPPGVDSED
jgi:hypothetical protein